MFFKKCIYTYRPIVFLVGHHFSNACRHCMSYTMVNFRHVAFDATKSDYKGEIN